MGGSRLACKTTVAHSATASNPLPNLCPLRFFALEISEEWSVNYEE